MKQQEAFYQLEKWTDGMKAIVNVNQSWGIGRDGELLAYIPEDMRFFRNTTKGGTVIMGRKTLESFPGGKPLKGRLNIVLTREPERLCQQMERLYQEAVQENGDAFGKSAAVSEAQAGAGIRCLSLDDCGTRFLALDSIPSLLSLGDSVLREAYVIGGAQIYRELLPYCSECLVTVNDSTREADTFFPNLDEDAEWRREEESEEKEYEGIHYRFTTYRRIGGGQNA